MLVIRRHIYIHLRNLVFENVKKYIFYSIFQYSQKLPYNIQINLFFCFSLMITLVINQC